MAEVTPSKRQENLERFQNRLAGYKKHSQESARKYQQTFDAIIEQDSDQTLFLKSKFLASKERKASKHKLNSNNQSLVSGFILCSFVNYLFRSNLTYSYLAFIIDIFCNR